jgi:hypothetical protein
VTLVFSLFSAAESTEKKIFAAPQVPTNQRYRIQEEVHFDCGQPPRRITTDWQGGAT